VQIEKSGHIWELAEQVNDDGSLWMGVKHPLMKLELPDMIELRDHLNDMIAAATMRDENAQRVRLCQAPEPTAAELESRIPSGERKRDMLMVGRPPDRYLEFGAKFSWDAGQCLEVAWLTTDWNGMEEGSQLLIGMTDVPGGCALLTGESRDI